MAAGVQKPGLPGRMRERGQGHKANERARGAQSAPRVRHSSHGRNKRTTKTFPVAMRLRDTPVLIPNTKVKT